MVVYGQLDNVRRLARSALVSEFSDAEIGEQQVMAQAKIWTVTQKNDWSASDYQFEYIKKLEEKQAAIYVLEHYNVVDIAPILELWQKQIDEGLTAITDTIVDSPISEPDLEIASKDYQTYPLNPDALVSRGRLYPRGLSSTGFQSKYDLD